MSARFKFYLDDILLQDEPKGWDDVETEIVRDSRIHGLLVLTKVTLTFVGDGYAYIDCINSTTSFCNEIRIRIDEQCSDGEGYETICTGLIKIPDVTFDMNRCTAKAPIIDNSYYARISNNKDIEAYPHVGKSKNGEPITAATLETLTMFDPGTGVYGSDDRKAYRVFEVFKFLVAYMSDNEVEFASDYFNIGGEQGALFITNGLHLSTSLSADFQNPDIGKIAFADLIEECYKLFNIGFAIETGGAKPVLRIEPASYFYGSAIADTLKNANGVTKKIKTEQLYAQVNFGSSETINDTPWLSFPEDINFVGFKDETYALQGQCNVDTTLNLKGDYVRSSNVIQFTIGNPDDSRDEQFFFIQGEYVSPGVYKAHQSDIFGIAALPYYYNGGLTNDKVATRFFGSIPNGIVQFLGNDDDTFLATRTTDSAVLTNPVFPFTTGEAVSLFDDDFTLPNHDVNNRYGNGTTQGSPVAIADCRYTANRSGAYTFKVTSIIQLISGFSYFNIWLERRDSADNYVGATPLVLFSGPWGIPQIINFSGSATGYILNAGDYITVKIEALIYTSPKPVIKILKGGTFECTGSVTGGGVFHENKPEDFKAQLYTFDYPISYARFKNIKANPKDILAFNIDGVTNFKPWIENFKYNHRTSKAQLKLVGYQPITPGDCAAGLELREDGGIELREDGGNELRE